MCLMQVERHIKRMKLGCLIGNDPALSIDDFIPV